MAYEPLSRAPSTITAGETVQWYQDVPDSEWAPGGDYALKVYLRGASILTLTATDDEGAWLVTVPVAQSEGLTAGRYEWVAYAESGDGTTRYRVATGTLEVTANLVTATAGARVSHAERTLAVIEAAIEGRLTLDMQSYVIDGRDVEMIPILELTRLRGVYAAMVSRQKRGSSGIRTHRAVVYGP